MGGPGGGLHLDYQLPIGSLGKIHFELQAYGGSGAWCRKVNNAGTDEWAFGNQNIISTNSWRTWELKSTCILIHGELRNQNVHVSSSMVGLGKNKEDEDCSGERWNRISHLSSLCGRTWCSDKKVYGECYGLRLGNWELGYKKHPFLRYGNKTSVQNIHVGGLGSNSVCPLTSWISGGKQISSPSNQWCWVKMDQKYEHGGWGFLV